VEVAGRTIVARVLPVTAAAAGPALIQAVHETEPEMILSLGLASGRTHIAIERVAINVLDFLIPDNDGVQVIDEPVVPGGPAAYFSTIPVKAVAEAWKDGGIPGYVSDTAGTYLCNAALYTALHLGAERGIRAGFIHLPDVPAEVARRGDGGASMSLETMHEAVLLVLRTALTLREDASIAVGASG
jgi:pyroglutamyl-peptidase